MSEFNEETTPLERALVKGNKSQLECFLKAGVDPNLRDRKENSLLYNAVKNRQYEIVLLLLSYKANLSFINSNGDTVLHLATRQSDIEMCKILLQNGASLTCKNVRNQTPITIALKENIEEVLLFFFSWSPELFELKDSNGKSVFDLTESTKLKKKFEQSKRWNTRKAIIYARKYSAVVNTLSEGLFKSLVSYL